MNMRIFRRTPRLTSVLSAWTTPKKLPRREHGVFRGEQRERLRVLPPCSLRGRLQKIIRRGTRFSRRTERISCVIERRTDQHKFPMIVRLIDTILARFVDGYRNSLLKCVVARLLFRLFRRIFENSIQNSQKVFGFPVLFLGVLVAKKGVPGGFFLGSAIVLASPRNPKSNTTRRTAS